MTTSIRLRHPRGVSTIALPMGGDTATVGGLKLSIYAETGIPPSRQMLKSGYPPRTLEAISELPVSSLGLQNGDQIIVFESPAPTTQASKPPPVQRGVPTPVPQVVPPPIQQVAPQRATNAGPDSVEVDGRFLIHRVVPDDNSCLFSAVALCFEQTIVKAPDMRRIVAEGISNDPTTYNEAILGMPPSQYISTILKPSTWGGAIELNILAAHYRAEIASIDVETGRIDRFGAGGMCCVLIYSGIHYDAVSLAPTPDAPAEWHQTLFPLESFGGGQLGNLVFTAAKKLVDNLRAKKAYTNTATFDLKCECGQGIKGEKGARAHAEQTGHVHFGEY